MVLKMKKKLMIVFICSLLFLSLTIYVITSQLEINKIEFKYIKYMYYSFPLLMSISVVGIIYKFRFEDNKEK